MVKSHSIMTSTEVKTPLREVRLRVALSFTLFLMANDTLNPVKVICNMIGLDNYWASAMFLVVFLGIVIANAKELSYFSVKVFFHSIMSIFFSSMEVLGRQNIPEHGPVIFTGNHMNQFVDGVLLLVTTPRRVSFLVAEKSFNKPVIGDFCKAVGSIPVSRPQDKAKPGPGLLCIDGNTIKGDGNAAFTTLLPGDRIRPENTSETFKFSNVVDDNEGTMEEEPGSHFGIEQERQRAKSLCVPEPYDDGSEPLVHDKKDSWLKYDILKPVDQAEMFACVHKALAEGRSIGIFPEGGSHDNTDLLPLKAGVAAIALGVLDTYDINVPIVPVGLNYFRGHHFRGR